MTFPTTSSEMTAAKASLDVLMEYNVKNSTHDDNTPH